MNEKDKKIIDKLLKIVIFCFSMIIICTIVTYTLKAVTGYDYSTEYGIFVGVFGGELLLTCALKIVDKITKAKE